jgi:ankyrin repeat protein
MILLRLSFQSYFATLEQRNVRGLIQLRLTMSDASKEVIKAAKNGLVESVKVLLASDADLVNARDKDGSTPLHCAVWKGHREVVVLLIDAGANVNAHNENDHWGTTPLHAATHANQAAIAQLLIGHGADVNAKDREGRTPMFHTTFHKAKAVAKVLERYN